MRRLARLFRGALFAVPLLATLFGLHKHEQDPAPPARAPKRWLAGVAAVAGCLLWPAVSLAAGPSAAAARLDRFFGAGFVQAFSLIFLSEVGDKTFFIAGLLAVKYGKVVSYFGSMGALSIMSVLAVLLGQV